MDEPKTIDARYRIVKEPGRDVAIRPERDAEWVAQVFDGTQVRRPPLKGEPFWGPGCTWLGWIDALNHSGSFFGAHPDYIDQPVTTRSRIAYWVLIMGFAALRIIWSQHTP